MKYNIQMSTEEYIATLELFKVGLELVHRFRDAEKKVTELRKEILALKTNNLQSMFEEDSSEDDDSEEYSEEEAIPPISVIKGGKAFAEKARVGEGKKAFAHLIKEWAMNFDSEGEQPDRGELIRALASSKDGPNICTFVEHVGGLTKATKSVWPEKSSDFSLMRKVAENITQVASILFPPLAEHLKYPNPLMEQKTQ